MKHVPLLLIVVGLAGTAAAQQPAYVGVGASSAHEKFDLPRGSSADDTYSIDVLAGYRVSPLLAVEADAEFLWDFDLDQVAGGDIDGVALTGNAKLFPPMSTGVVQPFALVGAGLLDLDGPGRIDANNTNWMFNLGGGVDFPLTEAATVEVRGAYRFPQGALDDFRYWTVGANVQYHF